MIFALAEIVWSQLPMRDKCSRGETPPILAHALKSGLGATRPSPSSTPKRMSMAYKRGKSPGGNRNFNSITTPRSPAFEEYRQQVDTLTNQIRSQLTQVSAHKIVIPPRESTRPPPPSVQLYFSPRFHAYAQFVLTNVALSSVSWQTEQAELRAQVLSQLAHLDEEGTPED